MARRRGGRPRSEKRTPFGQWLDEHMARAGVSRAELLADLKLQSPTVWRWETRPESPGPRADEKDRIREYLEKKAAERAPPTEPVVERDDETPPYQAWPRFLANPWVTSLVGDLRDWTIPHVQGIRFRHGEPSLEEYLSLAQTRAAAFKGKALPAGPIIDTEDDPDAPSLPPPKKRK